MFEKGHQISGVISAEPSIQNWARSNKLRLIMPDDDLLGLLRQQPFDLFFSIDNFYKVPNEILTLPRMYAINFHDAPLPKYAGVNATNWAIINGETLHGITWHIMTDLIDAGDFLKQKTFSVYDTDTAYILNAKCYEESIKCFGEMMDELAKDQVQPIQQNLENRTYFPRWKRPPAACSIDWTRSADKIYALFRALDFRTYWNPLGLPKLYLGDDAVIVKQMNILGSASSAPTGTITTVSNGIIIVATATQEVALGDFCSFSGVPITPSQFLKKSGLHEGSRLPKLDSERSDKITRIHSQLCRYEDFWIHRLASLEPIEVPYKKRRVLHGDATEYQEERFSTSMLTRENRELAEKQGDVVLAAFLLYLSRIGVKESFDTNFRDRSLQQVLMGEEIFFASHVPLRIDVDYEQSFKEFFKAIQNQIEFVGAHGSYARDLALRDPGLHKTFIPHFSHGLPVVIERIKHLSGYQPKCRGELIVVIPDDGKECLCFYDKEVLEKAAIGRLREQFTVLLKDIALGQDRPIGDLSILPEQERQQILGEWNSTQADYPRDKCLHELFEEQVERTPDNIALVFKNEYLTYKELNERANQLAHFLWTSGVRPEVPVGVYMERSLEMVISLYGILKAGGAYVPLDPEYPPERVAFMLEDTHIPVILTQKHLVASIPELSTDVFCVDTDWPKIAQIKTDNLNSGVTAENLAYVIFTSGSTGRPKGVMNEHRGICNRLIWMQDEYQLNDTDRIFQKTPYSFDVSVWEFFWPLLYGARLVVAQPGGHRDSAYLVKTIVDEKITTIHFVPSMLQIFLEDKNVDNCKCLKRVICSGEALPYELQDRFFKLLDVELHNLYGPTEAAVDVTHWTCQRDSEMRIVPIGRPVANTQTYILNRYMQPVPIGVSGELHLGGVQVARGYLNRPELTAEKFVPDPFSHEPGARLYKTGDLCRYLPDGNIEYLGRNDFQVKIRGLRIEIGEIEAVLSQHPAVREAVVLAREDIPSDKRLVAYLVSNQQSKISIDELRNFLKEKLADYMMPSAFLQLEEFPLTSSGKVDRRSLPAPGGKRQTEKIYVAPQGKAEQIIAGIWRELLKIEQVGVRDNFFDLGGHSLLLVRMMNKLQESFNKELSVVDMFQRPTIKELAKFLTQEQRVGMSFDKIQDRAMRQKEILSRQRHLATSRRNLDE